MKFLKTLFGGSESMNVNYKVLDDYFVRNLAPDERKIVTFLTYFNSKEAMFQAFHQLSFAEIDKDSIRLPEGISLRAHVITDMNRKVLVFFTGRFTKGQAREVLPVYHKYADHVTNKKHLAEIAAQFAVELSAKGGGGLIWTP